MRVLAFSIFLALLFGAGCMSDMPIPEPPEPTQFRHAFFPLAVGNNWVYEDTTMTMTGPKTGHDTLRTVGWHEDSLGIWWKLDFSEMGSHYQYELMERNDSVFTREYYKAPVLRSFAALMYIEPPTTDTTFFTSFIGGDVLVTMAAVQNFDTYQTPLSNYRGYVNYSSRETNRVETVVRGVGLVGSDELYITAGVSEPIGSKMRLKSKRLIP